MSDSNAVLFPLRDHNPRTRFPVVTVLLIAANFVAFLYELSLDPQGQRLLVLAGGAVPYEIANWVDIAPRDLLPLPGSIFTSMFLHGGWMHLLGNMWFLWLFGNNVEDSMGRGRYLAFYLLCGLAAAAAQTFAEPASPYPMIGASGAISGVMGAYVMLYPRVRIHTLIILVVFFTRVSLPAWVMLGYWFALQLLSGAMTAGEQHGGVAFWAHVGGFAAGAVLVTLFKRPALVAQHRALARTM
jgi:membrane associated rhomboid family serine protease